MVEHLPGMYGAPSLVLVKPMIFIFWEFCIHMQCIVLTFSSHYPLLPLSLWTPSSSPQNPSGFTPEESGTWSHNLLTISSQQLHRKGLAGCFPICDGMLKGQSFLGIRMLCVHDSSSHGRQCFMKRLNSSSWRLQGHSFTVFDAGFGGKGL